MSAGKKQSPNALSHQAASAAVLQKPNETLVLSLSEGSMTKTARKLYNVLLFRSQQELFEAEKGGRSIKDSRHLFRAPMSELIEYIKRDIESPSAETDDSSEEPLPVARVSKSDPRTAIKGYFFEMMRTVVEWKEPVGTVKWKAMPILSMAQEEQDKENSQRTIFAWRHQPEVFDTLSRKSGYTPINIDCILKLETYEAIALYEICARYNDPVYQTTRHEPDWWQKALSRKANMKLRDWRLFKNQKLKPAMEQINRLTDLQVDLVEEREGGKPKGKLLSVQFTVERKPKADKPSENTPPSRTFPESLLAKAAAAGIPTTYLASSSASDAALSMALDKLQARMFNSEHAPVESPTAYMTKILKEFASVTDVEEKKVAPPPPPKAQEIEEPPSEEKLAQREREAKVEQALREMSAEEIEALAEEVTKSAGAAIKSSLYFRKAFESKNWTSRLFQIHLQNTLGEKMFGAEWEKKV